MKTSDFHFDLPDRLIAKRPADRRRDSRLMVLDASGKVSHKQFPYIADLLKAGDLLVFNNTRVMSARIFGRKASGGRIEILIERVTSENRALVHLRSSKSPKAGSQLILDGEYPIEVVGRDDALFILESATPWSEIMEKVGHTPLPPYIDRQDELADKERYQTVYSKEIGAVAAPTAGLHFDQEMLDQLSSSGIAIAELTLHVGAGTFQPVRVDSLTEHKMHSEWMTLDQSLVDQINQTKASGGRIVAVGTTVVRSLESAAQKGTLEAYTGETDIFICPGYEFQVVDAMITNFHLPESTLMMLVSAFSGYNQIMAAYREAVNEQYRFFSYGDAMFLPNAPK